MPRQRSRKVQEGSVKTLIEILENDIEPKYGNRRKFMLKNKIYKQTKNKYHIILYRIIQYLDEERGVRRNKLSDLMRDYLDSVYKYYWQWKRTPTVTQMSPSSNNQIRFTEYIYDFERDKGESYWTVEKPEEYEVFEFEKFNVDADIVEV